MSEQSDTPDNSGRTIVYFYHHKKVRTSDGGIETDVAKFVNPDFFGSFFTCRNKELQEMEKTIHLMEEAVRERNMERSRERIRFLKQAEAGKLDLEYIKKFRVLDLAETYLIQKEKDEIHKLKEDYEKLNDTMISPLLQLPGTPPKLHIKVQ